MFNSFTLNFTLIDATFHRWTKQKIRWEKLNTNRRPAGNPAGNKNSVNICRDKLMPKCSYSTSQTTHKTKHTITWLVIKWTFSDIISFYLNLHRRSTYVYMTSNIVSHLERSFNYHRPSKTQSYHYNL